MIRVFSLLAIVLACLGLYALVIFTLNTRIKEVGVRKVLGASIWALYTYFVRRYVFQVLLATAIALPLIHYLLQRWLEGYAYQVEIPWFIYPSSVLFLTSMVLATVSYQILKATRVNPTALLRNE